MTHSFCRNHQLSKLVSNCTWSLHQIVSTSREVYCSLHQYLTQCARCHDYLCLKHVHIAHMCTWQPSQRHQQCETEAGVAPSVSSSRTDARPAICDVHQQAVQKLDAEVAALKSAAALEQHAASSQLDKTLDAHEQQVLALRAANTKLQLQLSELSQAVPLMLRCPISP